MKKGLVLLLSLMLMLSACALAEDPYHIVTDTEFRPFVYRDSKSNLVGIDVDILAAVAEDQDFDYTLTPLGWSQSIAACVNGEADGMIAGASITEARKSAGWIFSDGYYSATQSIAVAANAEIETFEDLRAHQVAVKIGTQGARYAKELKEQYGFTPMYFEDSPTMYLAVIDGECAACFDDTPIMQENIRALEMPLKLVEGTENEGAPYGMVVFSKEKQELLDKFNAGLANIKASGKYDEILAKYEAE